MSKRIKAGKNKAGNHAIVMETKQGWWTKKRLSLAIALMSMILLAACSVLVLSATDDSVAGLSPDELTMIQDDPNVGRLFSTRELQNDQRKLAEIINSIPDNDTRTNLIILIRTRQLKTAYTSREMVRPLVFSGINFALGINPKYFSVENERPGFLASYLVHENRHIEDWMGKHQSGMRYRSCELQGYNSHDCRLEWWDAEWRAFNVQAEILRKHGLTHAISTGPRVNNRAIFEKFKPAMAALVYLQENYYRNDEINLEFRKVFPEFYRNKLAEIGG
ncbi:MAG: hypothetical protein NTX82_03415 [Candidatus Parcubacteria bacterium]|nr:hypothetical protein [Candidatus Parcubacteria bacterium]